MTGVRMLQLLASKMSGMSLRSKIMLLAWGPFFLSVFYAYHYFIDLTSQRTETRLTAQVIELQNTLEGITLQLGRERGTSLGFVGSAGAQLTDQLKEARSETDARIERWNQAINRNGLKLSKDTQTRIHELLDPVLLQRDQWRGRVDALDASTTLQDYSRANRVGLDAMALLVNEISQRDMLDAARSMLIISEAAEAAGQERALVSHLIAKGSGDATQARHLREVHDQLQLLRH
ncbi:Hypothetical protein HDN1F_20870 [gamma proteobacterium HdN1]|nr:Hypothetical protein HDN1F_20870 [gamma proteobacterium HdN1]